MDMRKFVKTPFPPYPARKEDIFDPAVPAWKIACSLTGNFTGQTYKTFRKYWAQLGDDDLYREQLDVVRVIFSESPGIRNRGAFLNAHLLSFIDMGE